MSVSVRQTERTASRQRSEPPGWQPCHMLYSYYFVASGNSVESSECREICKIYLIKSLQTCRIPLSDTELGGHFVGVRYVPSFTTRNLTLLGINPRASLAPAVQTCKVQSARQLTYSSFIALCLHVYIQYSCKCLCVAAYPTEVHYVLSFTLLTLLLFRMVPLLPQTACPHPSLSLLVVNLCGSSFTVSAVGHSQCRCWLFSPLIWIGEAPCVWGASTVRRGT